MSIGVQIGYCPNPTDFLEYMVHFRPHFMTSVPRVWDKVYGMIHAGMKNTGGLKYRLFEWAKGVGIQAYRNDRYGLKYKIADKLVFSKIRTMLEPKTAISIMWAGRPLPLMSMSSSRRSA